MTHTCKVCEVTSDFAEFYDRPKTRCKECHKKYVRENREARADYYKEYDAQRFQNDPRVRERQRRYHKTEAGKASIKKSHEKWREANQEKRAAHIIFSNAVRDRRLEKPDTCQTCGASDCRIEGHHEDYSKPLEVMWVCRACHVAIHRGDR